MATPYPIAGASIAMAGVDKLVGDRAYQGMFAQLGWSERRMRQVGAAEALGGVLMIFKPTRRLGASIVLAASTRVILAELQHGEVKLAAQRGGVVLAALAALALPG